MHNKTLRAEWETYREQELERVRKYCAQTGYEIDETQPHIGGERYLMMLEHDIGESGFKLVLTGRRTNDGQKVIIKASSTSGGKKEITREQEARRTIARINFGYQTLLVPKELLAHNENGCLIVISEFIEQDRPFIERPIKDQFDMALAAFKAQESIRATTSAHTELIKSSFGMTSMREYQERLHTYLDRIEGCREYAAPKKETLRELRDQFSNGKENIERYSGFLTHADFVPHNLRISGGSIYLIDHASLHFGNKYESWGRFTNFMTLYNPTLEDALVAYVRNNRTKEEHDAFFLMRLYKLGYLIHFYTKIFPYTEGTQRELTHARLLFWGDALRALLSHSPLRKEIRERYIEQRDALRSIEEKKRQIGLH
jgi:hypothetical protein